MSVSDEDLQKYVGQSLNDVKQELQNQGFTVHTVRTGTNATGFIPRQPLAVGEDLSERKDVTVIYSGDDPQHKVTKVSKTYQ